MLSTKDDMKIEITRFRSLSWLPYGIAGATLRERL
jgi:hypothetical protein